MMSSSASRTQQAQRFTSLVPYLFEEAIDVEVIKRLIVFHNIHVDLLV